MKPFRKPHDPSATTEMLILPDGRILVHNLTPDIAALLAELNPDDELMRQRADPVRTSPCKNRNEHQTGN